MNLPANVDSEPAFLGFPLRSLLTACMVGATFGLLAGFTSIMQSFLGHTGAFANDLLLMQLLGLVILAAPWGVSRAHWQKSPLLSDAYWTLVPKWLTAALIVTIGTAASGLIALVVAVGATGRTFDLVAHLPGLSIAMYSFLWMDCFIGRRKLSEPGGLRAMAYQ